MSGEDPTAMLPDVRTRLATEAATQLSGRLGAQDLQVRLAALGDHTWRCGPLQPLVDSPGVTDVLVTADGQTWVDCGEGLQLTNIRFPDSDAVRTLAVRLATTAGRRLDDGQPWVDARLPGGIRLHAVVPPVSPEGTTISLRVLRRGPTNLETLVASGSLPGAWAPVLAAMISTRAAFLITGGTGTGKTTLLSALLSGVPRQERIVLVEDVGELRPDHPHVVRLEARHANVEGRGEIGLDVLVRQALRMRPDRIVVGECRGAEVRDLLAALNTGHAGGCGTLHANAAREVPARLEALGLAGGLPREALHAQAGAALHVVVHLRRHRGQRQVCEIGVVQQSSARDIVVQPALHRDQGGCAGWPILAERIGWPAGTTPPAPSAGSDLEGTLPQWSSAG